MSRISIRRIRRGSQPTTPFVVAASIKKIGRKPTFLGTFVDKPKNTAIFAGPILLTADSSPAER
jgi:hypothetical protein